MNLVIYELSESNFVFANLSGNLSLGVHNELQVLGESKKAL